MYVWRGKQRRDRREFLLGGVKLWGAPKGTKDKTKDDERMRQIIEDRHVHTFEQRVRVAIFRYLNTKQGKEEILQVVEEMDKINIAARRKALEEAGEALVDDEGNEIKIEAVPEEMKKKANIHEIFRKFDEDGSDSIDRHELRVLLDELRVPMTDDELAELVERLDSDGGGEIEFDEFYDWFVAEAENAKARNRMTNASNMLKDLVGRIFKSGEDEDSRSDSIYKGFKQMVLEVEARNLILDSAVHNAKESIRKEFRIAHPPLFLCEHENCGLTFFTLRELNEHMLDTPLHRTRELDRLKLLEKFQPVENALEGIHGRQLKANRMLFNSELGTFEGRILAAVPAPFRPKLNDPGGKREAQQREGILVRGSDPKAGVRAIPRTKGLKKQHRAPGGRKPGTDQLQDVVIELLHCRDHKIDVHVAPATSSHAEVMFCWNGYARDSIFIKGNFNGWQPEELYPHERAATGQNVLFKLLAPGKYRYRYIIDGKDTVDPNASIEDPEEAPVESEQNNILLVINPTPTTQSERSGSVHQLFGGNNLNHINLRNACVFDDGAWALASYMSKNSFIKTLDLSYNSISDEGMHAIAAGLVNFVGLENLKINGNGFGYDGCTYLFRTLNEHKCIKVLEMSDNRIADDGAEVLSELVVHHLSLMELYLDSCYIGNYGIQKLGDSLESNRTLEKISLSKNRFDKDGIAPFMRSVNLNGKLRSLILSFNNLGAEGVRHCGDILLTNDSLRVLDLSYTNALSNNSGMGIHALGTALRTKNKGLQELYLLGNKLNEEVLPEFAYSLHFNRGLRVCDLRANNLDEKWFKPNHTIPTKLMEDLPSIQTCMDRNIKLHQDPVLSAKFSVKPRPMEDTNEGLWTVRRRWRQLNKKGEKQQLEAEAIAAEQARIDLEEEYIQEKLDEEMLLLEKFMKAPEGVAFCKHLSKCIASYIHALASGIEAHLTTKLQKAAAANEQAQEAAKQVEERAKEAAAKGPVLSNIVARKEEAKRLERQKIDEAKALKKIQETLEQTEAAAKMHEELSQNWVAKFHLGVLSTIFVMNGSDENYFLEPQKIDRIFTNLCLPLIEKDAVDALNKTVILGGKNMIGLKRFTKYIKNNSYSLAQTNRLKRFRLLADLIINPPIEEAKTMLKEFHRAQEIKRLTLEYRMLPRMKPNFLCMFCNRRFLSQKLLARHKRKLSNHQRYLQRQDVMNSLQFALRRAKYFMTGTYFPAYYELAPEDALPDGHLPQIFDSRGIDGRPIGVLEAERTIRAEDSLGYWVKVRWGDGFGWMVFRTGTIPPKDILVPAMRHVSKGFWTNADIWENPQYYRLAEDLPENAEIKVRFMPALNGHGSEIVGYLKKGWIIECGGINGDFIQIKYNNYECVWALHKLNGKILLERLNDALQNRLQYLVTKSPCVLTEEQLAVEEDELTAISSLKEEDGVAADVEVKDLQLIEGQHQAAQEGLEEEISVALSK